MIRLSAVVMAHPARKEYVEQLLPQLGDVEVVWDRHNNRWDTGRRSLLAHSPTATHQLVVQDDAVVPQDLLRGVARMLEYCSPEVPISLYTGKSRPNPDLVKNAYTAAQSKGATWLSMPGPWWGVATVTPTAAIPDLVAYCDADNTTENYDLKMAHYWKSQGINCLYTVPSLVDHRQGPSLVRERNGKGRIAYRSLPALDSALGVEWNTRCVLATAMPEENRGEIRALDPKGKVHIVTVKAFRLLLASKGWILDGEREVSSLATQG